MIWELRLWRGETDGQNMTRCLFTLYSSYSGHMKKTKRYRLQTTCNKLIVSQSNACCFWLVWLNTVYELGRAGKESESAIVWFLFVVVQPLVVSSLIPYVQNSLCSTKRAGMGCVCIDVQIQMHQLFRNRRLRKTCAEFCEAVMQIFLDAWLCKR